MKKLFGHKPKNAKSRDFADDPTKQGIATPVYQKLATHGAHIHSIPMRNNSVDDERWEVVRPLDIDQSHLPNPHPPQPTINTPSRNNSFTSLPSAAHPPTTNPVPPRSSSPMSVNTQHSIPPPPPPPNKLVRNHDPARDAHYQTRKKPPPTAPVALNILRALDPPVPPNGAINPARSASEERLAVPDLSKGGDHAERKERRGFWGTRDKDKDKDKEKDKDVQREMQREKERLLARDPARGRRDDDNELTRMIGYLTATGSEDWDLVMDVCRRASSNESSAKEAARALRREFKYGEPAAQLSAARLWALMLRNSTDVFITHTTTRKFLDTLEELLNSPRTAPVVRERLLDIVAAAAYASRASKQEREGFKGLWKRVKPVDKPDEGIPFDTADSMLLPPVATRTSGYDQLPVGVLVDGMIIPESPALGVGAPRAARPPAPRHNRVIPQEEDMSRLSKECMIGISNAQVLSQSLGHVKPDELKRSEVIKEFYVKCRRSHELIFGQIAWATALAEQATSKREKNRKRTGPLGADEPQGEISPEEKLLADLLAANEELQSALNQYADLLRIYQERKARERSKREYRRDQRNEAVNALPIEHSIETPSLEHPAQPVRSSSSRSSSPASRNHSPVPTSYRNRGGHIPKQPSVEHHDQDYLSAQGHGLGVPRAVPHGPRLPAPLPLTSRTPSPVPDTPKADTFANGRRPDTDSDSDDDIQDTPIQPSAKALGKRKQVDSDSGPLDAPPGSEGSFYGSPPGSRHEGSGDAEINDEEEDDRWHTGQHHTHFVYDAVAERTRARMEALKLQQGLDGIGTDQDPHQGHIAPPQLMVNGVH